MVYSGLSFVGAQPTSTKEAGKSQSSTPAVGSVVEGNISMGMTEKPSVQQEELSPSVQVEREQREEKKLAIMMMSKKRKRLYDQIMKSRRKKAKEVSELKRKRRQIESTVTEPKRPKIQVS